ncbi:MAG TPA: DNA polymerase III subunit gamma and tau, partial [Cryptosporangiaceae bacterium]|nr:DNA polymerase III subunit gamma and tau [Cryptosporangiaceae bacterium]
MANLALYRKYRPGTFDEVIGQEHVTAPLIQALKNGKLHHAYLFSGPRGCGKTSSARILARSLNCEAGPTPQPCGECDPCVALASDGPGSLDVIEIDAASHGGVDDARDLRERAFFAPVSSHYKIYVIDEAHMVSSAGFNALLKLVEEPPDFVKFVFATTEPEKVLPTIRSRTHHYPFRLIPPGVMRGLLEQICAAEQVTVEPTVFPLIVRAGGGSARDSLSILDQLLSGAGEEGVTYSRALGLLGVTDGALLDEACDALAAADGAGLFATVDRVVEAGHDPRRFAADLLERLRDLLILEQVPDAAAKGLIDAPAADLERMTGQALRLGSATLSRMADVVHTGLVEMRGATAPRLLLELICARLLLPGAEDGHGALLQRLERLERRFDISTSGSGEDAAPPTRRPREGPPATPPPEPASATAPPTAAAAPAPAPAPVASAAEPVTESSAESSAKPVAESPAPPAAEIASTLESTPPAPAPAVVQQPAGPGQLDAAAVRRVWPEVIERVKKRRVVWSLLQNATPREVVGDELVLVIANRGLLRRFADDQVVAVIQEALLGLLGVRWRIRAEADDAPTGAATVRSSGRPAEPVPAVSPSEGWPEVASVGPPADEVPLPPDPPGYEGFDPGDE